MHSTEANLATLGDMTQLHAATCVLMTRFINGFHCPKLAHIIVQQLQRVLASRETYRQLLEHWQNLSTALLEQKTAQPPSIYHRFIP